MECPVCYSQYDQSENIPHMLSCGHTFCVSCVTQLISRCPVSLSHSLSLPFTSLQFFCPHCKTKQFTTKQKGIDNFPRNYSLLETLEEEERARERERERERKREMCPVHSNKGLDIFDDTCKKMICSHCLMIGEHNGHRCLPLDHPSVCLMSQSELQSLTETLSRNLSKISESSSHTHREIASLTSRYEEKREEIDHAFNELIQQLERRRIELQIQLKDIYEKERNFLKNSEEIFNNLQECCESLLGKCSVDDDFNALETVFEGDLEGEKLSQCQNNLRNVGNLQEQYLIFQKQFKSSSTLFSSSLSNPPVILHFDSPSLDQIKTSLEGFGLIYSSQEDQDLCSTLYLRARCGDRQSFDRLRSMSGLTDTPTSVSVPPPTDDEKEQSQLEKEPEPFLSPLQNNVVSLGYLLVILKTSKIPDIIPCDSLLVDTLSSIVYSKLITRSSSSLSSHEQVILGYLYEHGLGCERDESKAVSFYRLSAEKNNSIAQNNLGWCYYKGRGIEQNLAEAVKWYRLAAETGHAIAQNNLGLCYKNGEGIEQSLVEAVRWYTLSSEQGYAQAQNNLGICYQNGEGVSTGSDVYEAARLFQLSAEQGYSLAQNNLGRCYEYGYGVERNEEEAIRLYCCSIDQGGRPIKMI